MNTENVPAKRQYDTRLRESQAEQTRSRILAALAEQIGDAGLSEFSIEQVARKAGVSTRTVYHYFPNRDALFDGVTVWLDQQAVGLPFPESPTTEQLLDHLRMAFEQFDQYEALIRAQLVTGVGRALRERGRSQRRPAIEALVRREAPGLSEEELRRATALVHYLGSSEAWRSMKDESSMSSKEAGEAVTWAIRTLLDALRNRTLDGRAGSKGDDDGDLE